MPHRRYTETPARARSETHYLLLYCCRLTTAVRLVPLLLLLKLPCVRNITRILKNSRARRVQTSNLFFFFYYVTYTCPGSRLGQIRFGNFVGIPLNAKRVCSTIRFFTFDTLLLFIVEIDVLSKTRLTVIFCTGDGEPVSRSDTNSTTHYFQKKKIHSFYFTFYGRGGGGEMIIKNISFEIF